MCCLLCLNCIVFCLLFEVFQFSIFFFQSPSVQIREISFFWNVLIECTGTLQQVFQDKVEILFVMIEKLRNKVCIHRSTFLHVPIPLENPLYILLATVYTWLYTTWKEGFLIPTYDRELCWCFDWWLVSLYAITHPIYVCMCTCCTVEPISSHRVVINN